jgi:hypothetical protein
MIGLGVYTLGEFAFCPRAGALAALQQIGDDDPAPDDLHLDFLPRYSLAVIEEELSVRFRTVGTWAGRFLGLCVATAVTAFLGWRLVVLGGAAAVAWTGWRLTRELRQVVELAAMRRAAVAAEPKQPPDDLTQHLPVNWWELLNAGFDSVVPQEAYRDDTAMLAGKPWRILRKGELRIPVIRLGHDQFEGGRYWVEQKHEIKLTAYAHLLENCEGGSTPYGVALFGGSHQGVAVPITNKMKTDLSELATNLRRALAAVQHGYPPPAPTDNRCAGCHFGKPEKAPPGAGDPRLRGTVYGRSGSDGTLYHSACGDLFEWVPPHLAAKRKGLLPPGS